MRFLLFLLLCSPTWAQSPNAGFPLIVEHVDELWVIHNTQNDYGRVVFIRDQNVLATRLLLDDMIWSVEGDRIQVAWRDYWTAERIVTADSYTSWVLHEDPTQNTRGAGGQWWNQWRNMRDLRQPE